MSAPFQKRDLLPRRLVALRDWHPTWSPDPAIPEEDQIADAEEDEEKEHFERHRLLGLQNVLAGQLRSDQPPPPISLPEDGLEDLIASDAACSSEHDSSEPKTGNRDSHDTLDHLDALSQKEETSDADASDGQQWLSPRVDEVGEEERDWINTWGDCNKDSQLHHHFTISRDHTEAGSRTLELLVALRSENETLEAILVETLGENFEHIFHTKTNEEPGPTTLAGSSNHALQDYQLQLMLLEQQNKKRLMMARLEQDSSQPGTELRGMPNHDPVSQADQPPTTSATSPPIHVPTSRLDDVAQFCLDPAVMPPPPKGLPRASLPSSSTIRDMSKVTTSSRPATLQSPPIPSAREAVPKEMAFTSPQAEYSPSGRPKSNTEQLSRLGDAIKRLEDLRAELGSTTWAVFHKIEGDKIACLVKPSWVLGARDSGGTSCSLRGNSPLADEKTYLSQRPDVAFVVYKYYRADYQLNEIQQAKAEGKPLPPPVPSREVIRLQSDKMRAAVDLFLSAQPSFDSDFPEWDSSMPIESPFLFWYAYRSSGFGRVDTLPEPHRRQMKMLTGWIEDNYRGVYDEAEAQLHRGFVSASTMPFLYKPGEVLVCQVTKGIQGYIAVGWLQQDGLLSWTARMSTYAYDGRFYRVRASRRILPEFDDENLEVDIATLSVLPLRLAGAEIRNKLQRRGEMMWACRHRNIVACDSESEDIKRLQGHGERHVIDIEAFKKLHPDSATFQRRVLGQEDQELSPEVMACDMPPAGPELFTFPNRIVGYNLRLKKWQDLQVDLVYPVIWDKKAFEHLVIDDETKDIIQALVTTKLDQDQGTDLIQGKGNGLIILLHGGPGTGKTFTAESVAEFAEKPLFRVTCGDIGTKPEQVEKYLESALHLGKIWGCVVLLDEADVFLEQRTLTDLERNALVSVFLRVLEYYEGILVLTSNRVGTFDEAFKSRIQLSLHYETLDRSQRRQIWRNFLNRLKKLDEENRYNTANGIARSENTVSDDLLVQRPPKRKWQGEEDGASTINFEEIESYLTELANEEMNGREIRNAITTARQLAKFKGVKMSSVHLRHVIKVSRRFDRYLQRVKDGYTDDEVARGNGTR